MRCLAVGLLAVGLFAPRLAAGQAGDCRLTLAARAAGATSTRKGRLIIATADRSGYCPFTVTACVNDTSIKSCTVTTATKVRVVGGGRETDALQKSVQQQLPTSERRCSERLVRVGQTQHRRIQAAVKTSDGRSDQRVPGARSAFNAITLVCECAGSATTFSSTFAGIQKVIFERRGCTEQACHGSARQGGLDLSPAVAYQNLIGVPAMGSGFNRVEPGDQNRSFLWLKLAAKTNPASLPDGVQVSGAPMPNNLQVLSQEELDAVRLWIFSGAPQTGTVGGTEALLNACLSPPRPIVIQPLDPPAPGTGAQFVLPEWNLKAHSEREICFATYYDISAQVPREFQDSSGTLFRFSGSELRQDPQSHHLKLNRYIGSAEDIHDKRFGTWTCAGGEHAGSVCEPADLTSCGSGSCISQIRDLFNCLGFGPQKDGLPTYYTIGGAQKAQSNTTFAEGVFAQIPMKGILYWNSHAFNLTDQDTVMHGRLNFYFSTHSKFPIQGFSNIEQLFAPNAAPFTTQTVCHTQPLPQGARLFSLTSHTHKRGKHFTVTGANGELLYESFAYNDPLVAIYDPPLIFDAADPAQRILRYCAFYNNGVGPDGSPDVEAVTRYSRLPHPAKLIGLCSPVACVAGKVGAPCNGVGDDRACDSGGDVRDGFCDACPITGGESTENEMFQLIGNYFLDDSAVPGAPGSAAALDAAGQSLATEVALPPVTACGASHSAHAAHSGNRAD